MSNHNYSQYSKKNSENNVNAVIHEPVTEPEITTAPTAIDQLDVQTTPAVVTTPEVKMEPEVSTPAATTGIVTNCAKLNVRANPNTTADVVCILDAASKVTINVEKSTKDWFKVTTVAGIDGYCMRKFINADL